MRPNLVVAPSRPREHEHRRVKAIDTGSGPRGLPVGRRVTRLLFLTAVISCSAALFLSTAVGLVTLSAGIAAQQGSLERLRRPNGNNVTRKVYASMLLSIHPNHSIGFDFRVAEATEDPQFDDQFPLSHFRDSFQQIAKRLASYDTGRTLTIPYEHFGLQQPAPPFPLNVPKAMEDGLSNAKYFHECGRDKKRDLRFADASCLVREPSPTGRVHRNKQTQHNLKLAHESLKGILQSWSEFAGANDIRWWISHGNLLGWFWNARFLPWDVDLDIQMSTFQLIQLIPHNNTLLANRYLLEVNPAFAHRTPQPGNTIDARVTDTHTGYLMDITALTQFDASDARVHCKTPHPFRYEELMPLRETRLEGVTVWRPNRVISILAEEYRVKSMVEIRFSVGSRIMYQWHPNQGEWVLKKG